MSVVCFKDGIMAGDTMIISNGVCTEVETKVFRTRKGHLIGCVGNMSILTKVQEVATNGGSIPKIDDPETVLMGVLANDKRITLFENSGPVTLANKVRFWAIGTGAEFALGAMAVGATAEEAVRIAMDYDRNCGGQITVVHL